MSNVRITKQFTFEMSHALYGYDGKCKNIHGHTYHLDVCIIGKPIIDKSNVKYGMVIDFGDLKKIVKSEIVDVLDHCLMLNKNTPHRKMADFLESEQHYIVRVDYQPTTENMIIDFAQKIQSKLPENVSLHSLKLRETQSSFAEWYASDQD